MDLDRTMQLEILEELKGLYPNSYPTQRLKCFKDGDKFNGNIMYLVEHGLVDGKTKTSMSRENHGTYVIKAKITAEGLDFLEDDGGLGAILNKVVVTFDTDDLHKLIKQKLDAEEVEPEKKSELLKTIRNLPSEGARAVYIRLLNYGLDKVPDVYDLLKNSLQQ